MQPLLRFIKFRLPAIILDLHVHGRDFTQHHKTTIFQVLKEAIGSLVSVVAFMPNTEPKLVTIGALDACLLLINRAKSVLRITKPQYVWFGVTNDNLSECAQALARPEVIGLKIYSEWGITNKTMRLAMRLAKQADKVVAIHCDDPTMIKREGYIIGAEVFFIKKVLLQVKQVPGVKVMICHVSSIRSAELILAAQKHGMLIALELCIQYLWFDEGKTNKRIDLSENFYRCLNRLRGKIDREYFINRLLKSANRLIFVHSDNACHTEQEKIDGANGIPSIQELVNGLVTLAVRHEISEQRVAELLSFNAIDFFNLPLEKNLVNYKWELKPDNKIYNHGVVINPWQGLLMYQPINKSTQGANND